MIIERRAGYINFQLEDFDFDYDWRRFLRELKEQISPRLRKYDKATRWWSIKDNEVNVKILRDLRKKHFEDENQEELEL